uniref:STXB5 n=1 Tax=Macrostomum lignano TaxID=282301 RepID=A0A1I8G7Q0_9PLAT
TSANLKVKSQSSAPVKSLATPCVLCSSSGTLLSVLSSEGPQIVCMDDACTSVLRTVRLSVREPVTDMCWSDQTLLVCSGGQVTDCGREYQYFPKLTNSQASELSKATQPGASAVPPQTLLTMGSSVQIYSAAFLSGQCFFLQLKSPAVRVCDSQSSQISSLSVTSSAAASVASVASQQPRAVRVCRSRRLVFIVYPSAVLVCQPDGQLSFQVGPKFSDA